MLGTNNRERNCQPKCESGREISVSRRGGAAGGHGGHSGHGGHGGMSGGKGSHGSNGHGDGTKSPNLQGGAATAIIPLYAAGAMNQHHRNYNHHHGTNSGTNNYIGLTYLAFTLLSTLLLLHFT
ncbi:hypothetical protein L1049_014305 [Liquidambar formosana]|uniref:Uncharacterized protein n=1 Tax=Liquidambar formosana TaxID=63359 RepID=A0AAP0RQU8_LIQFO